MDGARPTVSGKEKMVGNAKSWKNRNSVNIFESKGKKRPQERRRVEHRHLKKVVSFGMSGGK